MDNPKNNSVKVAVAMSGGVDSSVAAYLLKKQGFDVHGFYMRNWSALQDIPNDCPWQEDYEDVRRVCQHLGIPHSTLNFEKEYKERVLDYFLAEYQAGRTPNPDVLCNSQIKFDVFWHKVKLLGLDYMATGHYCKKSKIKNQKSKISLTTPKDGNKDQTYFLCGLTPEQLQNVIFPLADLTKEEVRKIAQKAGLPNANKKDSQGICFMGKLPVREFLKANLKLEPGKVVAKDGTELGEHEGSQLYTIGQRHIGIAAHGRQMYVAAKDAATNTVVMAEEQSLYTSSIKFEGGKFIDDLPAEFDCQVQIRYRMQPIPAKASRSGQITLKEPVKAVSPGQFIAFYKNKTLIGSAVIK